MSNVNPGQLPNLPDEMLLGMANNLMQAATKKPNIELNASMVIGFAECLQWICAARNKLHEMGGRLSRFSNMMADAAYQAGGILTSRPGRQYVALSGVPSDETNEDGSHTHINWVWIPQDDDPMVYIGDLLMDHTEEVPLEIKVLGATELSYIVLHDQLGLQLFDRAVVLDFVKHGKYIIEKRAACIEAATTNVREAEAQTAQASGGDADEQLRPDGSGPQSQLRIVDGG